MGKRERVAVFLRLERFLRNSRGRSPEPLCNQIQVLPPISRKSENGKKHNNGHKPPRKITAEVIENDDDFEDDFDNDLEDSEDSEESLD